MDKIQTFVYSINFCIGIFICIQFLSAVTACSQFECNYFMHLQFIGCNLIAIYNFELNSIYTAILLCNFVLQFYCAIFSCNSTVDAALSCNSTVDATLSCNFIVDATLSYNFIAS